MINIYIRELDATWIGLAHTEEKIIATALSHDKETTLKSLLRSLPPNANYQIVNKASDFAERTILALKEVHLGGHPYTDFTLATEYVPEPLASVLKIAASIPAGYVASYGNIAKTAGTEARVVGQIMASNPLYPIVQCHRVVGADYSLVGYDGKKSTRALKTKLARLNKERRGFKSAKEISVNGTKLTVHPVERVIKKAKKQGLSLTDRQQRTITSY
jgi:O-6-methylguanine DNA methyltransferase